MWHVSRFPRPWMCVSLLAVMVVLPSLSFGWTKFTKEELAMTAPDWCSDANIMVLSWRSEYYANPFEGLSGRHFLRVKVLTEKGKDMVPTDLVCYPGYKLWNIAARTVTPDGKTVKVKSSQIFQVKTYVGKDRDLKRTVYRVAFPEVTKGAILECEWQTFTKNLTFVTPHYFDVNGLPTMTSELVFTLPQGVVYQLAPVNMAPFGFKEKQEQGITADGTRELTYTATAANIRTDADKPYSPADDFLRPHVFFVFARYETSGINVPIVPDWNKAVELVNKRFAGYQDDNKGLPALYDKLKTDTGSVSLAEHLYHWVTDSLEFEGSRQWYDLDDHVDVCLKQRKATGVEKALILKELYRLAGIPAKMVILVPPTNGPTLTRLPTLSQFETYLLQAQVNGQTVFLDPAQEGTPFGYYSWSMGGGQGLLIDAADPEFVTIPSRLEANRLKWNLTCTLDTTGTLMTSGTLLLTHQLAYRHRLRLKSMDSTALKDYVANHFLSECTKENLLHAALPLDRWNDTTCAIDVAWKMGNYAERMGDDWLIKPNCVSRIGANVLPQDDKRAVDLYLSYPEEVEIESHFVLPEGGAGWKAATASMPSQKIPGFIYRAKLDSTDKASEFVYHRTFRRDYSKFKADAYNMVRGFYATASQNDNMQVVWQRKAVQ